MKRLSYRIITEVNHGTEEEQDIEQIFNGVTVYAADANLEATLAITRAAAYNGEVTVEDVPDEPTEPQPPTVQELAAENKLLRQQVVTLTDRGDFQEELIVELANIVYA